MIGKVYVSVVKYYDRKLQKLGFKGRPVLVVGKADDNDYVILPISRVTNRVNLDSIYDVEITQQSVPLLKLTQNSYIRAHKQLTVHVGELTKEIVDFRKEYPDLYFEVIAKMEQFQKSVIDNAFL